MPDGMFSAEPGVWLDRSAKSTVSRGLWQDMPLDEDRWQRMLDSISDPADTAAQIHAAMNYIRAMTVHAGLLPADRPANEEPPDGR